MTVREVLKRKNLSKRYLELAETYGGFCESDWEDDDKKFTNLRYCDKGDHLKRSIANNPNHLKHFRNKG